MDTSIIKEILGIDSNIDIVQIGATSEYYPITWKRYSLKCFKSKYLINYSGEKSFKNFSIIYYREYDKLPERIMFYNGNPEAFYKVKSKYDLLKVNDTSDSIFSEVFTDYFKGENENYIISGGIDKKTNKSQLTLILKRSQNFNRNEPNYFPLLIIEHINYITDGWKKIKHTWGVEEKIFSQKELLKYLKKDIKLVLNEKMKISQLQELIAYQHNNFKEISQLMSFMTHYSKRAHSLNNENEKIIYNGNTRLVWINMMRKYKLPDMILYFGTTIRPDKNRIIIDFSINVKFA